MTLLKLRYDLRLPGSDPDERAALYEAALDQIAWADRVGFTSVQFHEHHGTDDGYLPSSIVMAAAAAARTRSITIEVGALLVPLHDSLRLAEDLAVVDLLSRGRLVVIPGAGYVPDEFAMFGKQKSRRGRAVEEAVGVFRQAWRGEYFDHHGRSVRVTPRPYRDGGPPIVLGGGSEPAARRAARIGDGYSPHIPESWQYYRDEMIRLQKGDPGPLPPAGPRFLYVAKDPASAWEEIGPFLLYEMNEYGKFATAAAEATGYVPTATMDELMASPHYKVVTPDQCVALARQLGPSGALTFRPLAGGMAPDLAWRSLRLLEQAVLPALRNDRAHEQMNA